MASEAPLVVIVTPVFNGGAFLAETMNAVQAQTYPNLRHIVLDNASTDATPRILAKYAKTRVPVQIARNERVLPIAQNWNAAVALVPQEAKYFRVLCADDLMAPEFVARTVDLAERHPDVIVVGCGLRHREPKPTATHWDAHREVFSGCEAVGRAFCGTGLIIAHQTLIRRTALDLRKPFFDAALEAIDTDACFDLLRSGDWGFVHDVLATTRDHPGTRTRTFVAGTRINQSDHLVLLERYAPFAFGAEPAKKAIRQYLRSYLRRILRWRVTGPRALYERHLAVVRSRDDRPVPQLFLDALLDWPLAQLQLRRPFPRPGRPLQLDPASRGPALRRKRDLRRALLQRARRLRPAAPVAPSRGKPG